MFSLVSCFLSVQLRLPRPYALLQDYELAIQRGGKTRSYLLHVPPHPTTGRPLPLLMAFHGGGSSAAGMKNHYGIDRIADRFGYVVAYPNGSGLVKGGGLTCGSTRTHIGCS